MNEVQIRVRAYFHFVNKTGWHWQDPVSNWVQAELEEKLLAVTPYLMPYVCAILGLQSGRTDPHGIVAGGSGTFFRTRRAQFLVTAQHVVDGLFRDGVHALLVAGNGTQPIDISHLRDRIYVDRSADIATIALPDDIDISTIQRSFVEMKSWPPLRALKGEIAYFLGYPGLHRKPGLNSVKLHLTPFCDFVTSVSDRQFYLVDENLERLASKFTQEDLEPFGPTGGLSGSSVFVNRDGTLVPVGVLYEGGDGIDTMFFVTHMDRINEDGSID